MPEANGNSTRGCGRRSHSVLQGRLDQHFTALYDLASLPGRLGQSQGGSIKTLNAIAASALRIATRAYTRHAPWRLGKSTALDIFNRHVSWRPHRQVVRTRFGDRMDLSIPDAVSATIYMTGHWEPVITQYIRSRLLPGNIVVDCGANIGYYSLIASRLVGPSGRVFAIEASPRIHARLQRNLALNNCANVTAMHAAAAKERGELAIYLANDDNLGHSTTVQNLAAREAMNFESKVPADTLQNLVGWDNLRNARFVKIDVEGAEISVLEPLFDSLDQFAASTEWLIEFSPDFAANGQQDVDRIFAAFADAGYFVFRIPNEYGPRFAVNPPALRFEPLSEPPRTLCDVVISRNDLADVTA